MLNHSAILTDLQASLHDALQRADERLSHVQRQLAGQQQPIPLPTAPKGVALEQALPDTDPLVASVDDELAQLHATLAELIQQGRSALAPAA
jgi:small-conductance mechanosensitive channel